MDTKLTQETYTYNIGEIIKFEITMSTRPSFSFLDAFKIYNY